MQALNGAMGVFFEKKLPKRALFACTAGKIMLFYRMQFKII